MDEEATAAATVVLHSDSDTARLWLDSIRSALAAADEAGDASIDGFVVHLRSAVGSGSSIEAESVDTFAEHLATVSEPMAAVRQLADPDNADAALRLVEDAVAAADEEGQEEADEPVAVHVADAEDTEVVVHAAATEHEVEADSVAFDDKTWFAYLKQWNGGWDGAAATWPEFVRGFVAYAPDGTRGMAVRFVDGVAALPVGDRVGELAGYGIHVTPSDAATAVEEPATADEPAGTAAAAVEDPADDEDMGIAALMGQLADELVDEEQLAAAVERGDLRFEPIEDDDLDLSLIS